jgi:hypothetical protein
MTAPVIFSIGASKAVPKFTEEIPDPEEYGWQRVNGYRCFLPSPEEIHSECEAIKARWSADERYKRATGMPTDALVPVSNRDRVGTPTVTIDAA